LVLPNAFQDNSYFKTYFLLQIHFCLSFLANNIKNIPISRGFTVPTRGSIKRTKGERRMMSTRAGAGQWRRRWTETVTH